MKRTSAFAGLLAAVAAASVFAQDDASRLAAIAAAQQGIGKTFAASDLSPFTAVASRYFSGGDAARLVVGPDGPSFAETTGGVAGGTVAAEVSFDGRDVWVAPLAGGEALALVKKRGEDAIAAGPGAPFTARARLAADELVRAGRYYLETGARPGSGRAIVYDPEAALRKAFTGLHWFPPAPAFQLKASYEPIQAPDAIIVSTSRGLQKEYYRVGRFAFDVAGRRLALVALATSPAPKDGEELFVPFRDATTGKESYAVGRYLNVEFKGPGVAYVLDFNVATNPYCAYSPHYNCVIPPKENTLPVAIRAGEMIYAKH